MTDGIGKPQITDDCEFESYIRSLTSSSDRVRFILIAILTLTALLFVGYLNSSYQSWMSSRLEIVYLARQFKLWDAEPLDNKMPAIRALARERGGGDSDQELGPLLAKVEMARGWTQNRGFRNEEEVLTWLQDLHQAEIQNVLQLTVPFLGVRIDVNDLGAFGGLASTLLMLLLTFSLAREHENVFLALWKVRQLSRAEDELDKQEGRANLLYHALAMAQVLSKPPTLARWRLHWSRVGTKILFVIPLLVHCLVLAHDWKTHPAARIINPFRTNLNLVIEAAALILLAIFSFACIAYSWSSDMRWSRTFFTINPEWKDKPQPGWMEWVKLRGRSPKGAREEEGESQKA